MSDEPAREAALREALGSIKAVVLRESWPDGWEPVPLDEVAAALALAIPTQEPLRQGAALIPYGEPCPICGPKGHAHHEDDSYGSCVTCREYVPHTDDEMVPVRWPCPASRLASTEPSAKP